ncbi:MAG: class I SAM-dependent methyltransferase [Acidobacteria bacterium]|nr:class I SAM-dependent methyltransferase [Acidobacteriota bacterium]
MDDKTKKWLKSVARNLRSNWSKAYGSLRSMRRDYRQRFDMTLREWYLYHQRSVHFNKCHWMGVPALKNPLDAWIYQEILYEVKPEVIVEIGSLYGGSTLYFAHLLDLIGKGVVISVDIKRNSFRANHKRIVLVTGDSSSPEVVNEVSEYCRGKTVLVIHDGGHTKGQVLKDLRAYSPLVSVNSYFIVEDGIVDLFNAGDGLGTNYDGPVSATEQFLKENPHFVVDLECERYILTYNPRGYLKRIR